MFEYWQNAGASQSGGAAKRSKDNKVGRTKRLANGAVGVWKRVGGKLYSVLNHQLKQL